MTRWLYWFQTKLPPTFYNKIAPMNMGKTLRKALAVLFAKNELFGACLDKPSNAEPDIPRVTRKGGNHEVYFFLYFSVSPSLTSKYATVIDVQNGYRSVSCYLPILLRLCYVMWMPILRGATSTILRQRSTGRRIASYMCSVLYSDTDSTLPGYDGTLFGQVMASFLWLQRFTVIPLWF